MEEQKEITLSANKTAWIQTYTGIQFDLENPTLEMIDIRDIAHALSNMCRFNGHCKHFYSVAEHSVRMSNASYNGWCPDYARYALLHDASEAYLSDVTRPVKYLLGKVYTDIEERIQNLIYTKYNLPIPVFGRPDEEERAEHMGNVIKKADNEMLAREQWVLFDKQYDWGMPKFGPRFKQPKLWECWSPEQAEREFLNCFCELGIGTLPKN